jgi:hypothetical protein
MAGFSALNPTSYFSAPAPSLDPKLFDGRTIKAWARQGILSILHDYLNTHYRHTELWVHPWLAGSGVSYQWQAAREPADLDCLVGVDYEQFRKANPEFMGLSDAEISADINEWFFSGLHPKTSNWNGYELTFYVNPGATDIRSIKPYAAYDLKFDEWTVYPDPTQKAPSNPLWDNVAQSDADLVKQIHTRFTASVQDVQASRNDAMRRNAETKMQSALEQGVALFDEIHYGRRDAFSATGEGYGDFHNFRWQAGKASGAVQALRSMKEYSDNLRTSKEHATYGIELPDSNTLIRRAATYRAQQ